MNPFDLLIEYWPKLLDGAFMSLKLTFLSVIIAAIISPFLAYFRANSPNIAQVPLRLYISLIRGTPILAQLFLVYYGAGQFRPFLQEWGLWAFFIDPFNCALFTFIINTTAYQTEILRGGIMGVNHGEIEAGHAIGLSKLKILQRIILPHTYRIAWPALGNEIILMMKASALASVVTIFDIVGRTRQIFAQTFDFSIYLWAAALYLCITGIFVLLWRQAELQLNRHISPNSKN